MKISTILFLIIFSTSISFSQKVSKGFEYIQTKEYSKAIKIFNKAIKNQKNYVAGKYGMAIIYTRNDYKNADYAKAYKYIEGARKRFIEYTTKKKRYYSKNYGITYHTMDTLKTWILNTEYDYALNSNNIQKWNYFLDTYKDTPQAEKLEIYVDSVVFQGVKNDGSLFAYEKYIAEYPSSKYIDSAKIYKENVWKEEYNKAFRSLEITSIQYFKNLYPTFPYYDDSTQIYINLAKKAAQLKLHLGFTSVTVPYYGQFIKETAPHEMAYQTLLCLIQPNLEKNKISQALDTINKYKPYFGNFYKIDSLISILNRPAEKVIFGSISPNINTNAYEYMPVVTADDKTIYFCAQDRPDNVGGEDVFMSHLINGQWSKPVLIDAFSSASGNEAPLAISADGNTLIIFSNGDVFTSKKTSSGWSYLRPINQINTRKNWEADAYISPDGNAIFFSSDRPGNVGDYHKFSSFFHGDYIGNLDIYVIVKKDDGSWSEPINLGTTINTPYTERTPFLHPDMKTLYFASDGHPGVGKIDVFKCTRLSDTSWTEWSEPVNLGLGINTPKKEYGYKISTDGTKAYYTKFIKDQSDIYYMTLPENQRPDKVAIIQGNVTDINGLPLNADIVWEDLDSDKKLGTLKTDPVTGKYIITVPLGKNYGLYVSKTDYYPISDNVNLQNYTDNVTVTKNFQLVTDQQIVQGQATIELHNVFFETSKYDLKNSSFPELNRLANFIKQHPNIKIEISGHTDNQGSTTYNDNLSKQRALSVLNYLVSQGCNAGQLSSKGYGASKPVADNSTADGRQQNRRVEFKVLR